MWISCSQQPLLYLLNHLYCFAWLPWCAANSLGDVFCFTVFVMGNWSWMWTTKQTKLAVASHAQLSPELGITGAGLLPFPSVGQGEVSMLAAYTRRWDAGERNLISIFPALYVHLCIILDTLDFTHLWIQVGRAVSWGPGGFETPWKNCRSLSPKLVVCFSFLCQNKPGSCSGPLLLPELKLQV